MVEKILVANKTEVGAPRFNTAGLCFYQLHSKIHGDFLEQCISRVDPFSYKQNYKHACNHGTNIKIYIYKKELILISN